MATIAELTPQATVLSTDKFEIHDGKYVLLSAMLTSQTLTTCTLTSPTMTAPVLGVATATTINGVAISSATSATLTLANSSTLQLIGGYACQITTTGATGVTLPTSGTLATLTGTESMSNKTFSSCTFTSTTFGAISATSLATTAASPLLLTNGQIVTVALTSQTVGGVTLTIPDFADVDDEFVFKTKAVTMSNKTFVAPVLGAATGTSVATTAALTAYSGTATPAAASAVAGVKLGSASVGIYWGTGAPTSLTAPKGSLYIRTDGSSSSTRVYVNIDDTTNWVSVTTSG